jgi:hypothetical protein
VSGQPPTAAEAVGGLALTAFFSAVVAGLLARGQFGDAVDTELPCYADLVRDVTDTRLLTALFRDYTFAASAYLLEVRQAQSLGIAPKNL